MPYLPILSHNDAPMKYLFFILFALSAHIVFAQENRHAAALTPIDSAEYAVSRFDARITRLREALEQNNVSNMVSNYAHLLGDMRSGIEYVEMKSPESPNLTSMQAQLEKFGEFTFDPMKPDELRPYLSNFDEFLSLLKAELGYRK